ncbi:hypothetical protein BJY00DRAFT_312067 [Aspergillus carlsbadensis]|nr:hypothetical protein BJY00DRAFT_312067 [Aspergillus carlsbadensis]
MASQRNAAQEEYQRAGPFCRSYIQDIQGPNPDARRTREDQVDHLWNNILVYYFQRPQPSPACSPSKGNLTSAPMGRGKQTNIAVVNMRETPPKKHKCIVFEAKRPTAQGPDGEPTEAQWLEVKIQLQQYMNQTKLSHGDVQVYPKGKKTIVLSGLYTRYHESELRVRADRHIEWLDSEQDPWAVPDRAAHPAGPYYPSGAFYVVHDSCWQYAVRCFGEDMPSIEDLFDVFRELPLPKPCTFPRASELPSLAKPYPEPTARISSETNPSDHFRRLPLELRQAIALQLDPAELFALRHTSRAMGVIFHDRFFWKQQIRDRAFLDHLLYAGRQDDQHGHDEEPDWRLLYHVCSRTMGTSETTNRVWEVVQWIKEYLAAARNLEQAPLHFYGSALQLYHNDSARAGRRVERMQIPARLAQVAIYLVPIPLHELQPLDPEENVTDIAGLDFTDADGNVTRMGVRPSSPSPSPPGSDGYRSVPAASLAGKTGRNLRVLLYGGRGDAWNKCRLSNIAGARVVWDTDNSSFHGFRMYYDADGIYSMGVLHGESHPFSFPQVFGYEPGGCRPIHGELDEVEEVVATWEDQRLVDLGLRGRRKRIPFEAFVGAPLPYGQVNWGRYGQILKRKDAWDRRQPWRVQGTGLQRHRADYINNNGSRKNYIPIPYRQDH